MRTCTDNELGPGPEISIRRLRTSYAQTARPATRLVVAPLDTRPPEGYSTSKCLFKHKLEKGTYCDHYDHH